jgi:hypothetical protein
VEQSEERSLFAKNDQERLFIAQNVYCVRRADALQGRF